MAVVRWARLFVCLDPRSLCATVRSFIAALQSWKLLHLLSRGFNQTTQHHKTSNLVLAWGPRAWRLCLDQASKSKTNGEQRSHFSIPECPKCDTDSPQILVVALRPLSRSPLDAEAACLHWPSSEGAKAKLDSRLRSWKFGC